MDLHLVARSLPLLLAFLAAACHRAGPGPSAPESPHAGAPPRAPDRTEAVSDPDRPTAHVARSGRVALRSFELAGRVVWQGMSTCAGAVGGLFEDGWGGARSRWRSGAADTRRVAREQADGVRHAARIEER